MKDELYREDLDQLSIKDIVESMDKDALKYIVENRPDEIVEILEQYINNIHVLRYLFIDLDIWLSPYEIAILDQPIICDMVLDQDYDEIYSLIQACIELESFNTLETLRLRGHPINPDDIVGASDEFMEYYNEIYLNNEPDYT